jgi:ParB/RepB/Spo0J family partition protein
MERGFSLVEMGRIVLPELPLFRDEGFVRALAESIAAEGLDHPITLRRTPFGYEAVDGRFRFEAAQRLGWSEMPARILDLDERAACRHRLRVNSTRRRMHALEEARLLHFLLEQGDDPVDLAKMLGRSLDWVRGRLQLLERLSLALQGEVERGELGPTLALEIAAAPKEMQERIREAARQHGLSAYVTRRLVRYLVAPERTEDERRGAFVDPESVLAPRPRGARRQPTPIADHLASVSRAAASLARRLADCRGGVLADDDREACLREVAPLAERLALLLTELERFRHDQEEHLAAEGSRPLPLPGDRAAPAAPTERCGACDEARLDPRSTAAPDERAAAGAAHEADGVPVAPVLLQGSSGAGGPARRPGAEPAQGLREVADGAAGAPLPSHRPPHEGTPSQREAPPRADRPRGEGARGPP